MEVTKVFKGTKEDCFDIIVEALLHDVNQQSESPVSSDEIREGFTYKKNLQNRLGSEGYVDVTITKLTYPISYEANFDSKQGVNTISYLLEDIDAESFNLIYKESYQSCKKMNQWNFKIVNFFYKRSSKKRINLMFDQLQRLVLEKQK